MLNLDLYRQKAQQRTSTFSFLLKKRERKKNEDSLKNASRMSKTSKERGEHCICYFMKRAAGAGRQLREVTVANRLHSALSRKKPSLLNIRTPNKTKKLKVQNTSPFIGGHRALLFQWLSNPREHFIGMHTKPQSMNPKPLIA